MNLTDIVGKLADVVGREKAEDVVSRAARELGIRGTQPSSDDIDRLLAKLSAHPGVIGTAARVMRRRAQMDIALAKIDASSEPTTPATKSAAAPTTPYGKLVGMLAPALGEDKAVSLIEAAAKRRGLTASQLRREECMALLEDLAGQEGLVGTVARFAKARAHLELAS
ncbi:MAG: hypothetical protein M3Y87_03585 [Myxococcota bacterium]|nr:hypothetical protein [Myxococcota bacterium]